MKALVTGANGFLGVHVVSALLARGHEVRALIRATAKGDDLSARGVTDIVRADLRSARQLEQIFEGVDVLVHLAAAVTGGEDAQFASTVVGTERLLDAMARTTCRRIVLASSFSVYDWSNTRGVLDERSPIEPALDLYERDGYSIAKSWQERITRRFAQTHDCQLTVLRPGFIWGRDHAYLAALGIQVGRIHIVIGPTTRIPMTHVENCADLFALSAEDERAVGQTFNVVDGEGERIWSFLGTYLKGTGERGLRVPVPYSLSVLGDQGCVRNGVPAEQQAPADPHPVPLRVQAEAAPLHQRARARGARLETAAVISGVSLAHFRHAADDHPSEDASGVIW